MHARNPWEQLPEHAPYVLPDDAAVLARLGRDYGLHLDVLPQPFAGDRERATVCLLTLNPGYSETDAADHAISRYVEQRRLSLAFAADWPFPFLDPALAHTGGGRYWQSRLRSVVAAVGDARVVSERLFVVEHFPYASRTFDALPEILPSQAYTFGLVARLVRGGCLVVVARRLREWQLAIPELVHYPDQVVRVLHPRGGHISRATIGQSAMDRVVAALRG